ncbi:hypothetical protein GWI33_008362 [Rhynchophorus ferrugineus]|uniref:Uncharacterized protein n=1 Tax=Rhynchophorus ferrugineus TaxID=354439 RepID=A0A834MK22_RHYFE|nr:hypothetical protein GWI33_008362 [Rhynchophorus ferrugineus]
MKGVFGFLVICFVVFSVQNYVEADSLPLEVSLCEYLFICERHCEQNHPNTKADCSLKNKFGQNYCRCT